MKFRKLSKIALTALLFTGIVSCKDGNSIHDPDYTPSQQDPVITNITPEQGYLAGVDSVIVYGKNFATSIDSLIINFGGSPGIIKKASKTQLIVRPGTKHSEDSLDSLDVRVAVRGAEFFSNSYPYFLAQPFGTYPGLEKEDSPTTPMAVDDQNNVYTIINKNGVIRYTKITPDGVVTKDQLYYKGEVNPDTKKPYPPSQTMFNNSYSSMIMAPNGDLLVSLGNSYAILNKTFGDNAVENIYAISGSNKLKIQDMVMDNNKNLWVVGIGTDAIHRFPETGGSGSDVTFPFTGNLTSVAFYDTNNELYVGGEIDSTQQIWKYTIDGSGDLANEELYFDFSAHYSGKVTDMIFAANGELLITSGPELPEIEKPSIVRVFPSGKHEVLYEGMIKPGAFAITWRNDNIAVVGVQGEETSVNFLDMFDRTRAGLY